ncbi:L-2-amino-thiazoline-4-carboxylic acid hydrolase [Clostridium sp. UBA4548]|uniref:L-2-amino-thiazoline-4-carboxylic acid hydrolase n=1 Tax=Clostridium sp. UBA4548 TaxID=1946361 RepID=UPI0025C39E84|nr:L-2-amino-thiazoline-4-carboxylic acid hydrolase [Clostridium sp. UBA4548]
MDCVKVSAKEELQKLEFAYELNEFQMNRLERIISSLRDRYGDEVFEVYKEIKVSYNELLRWYLIHTFDVVSAMKNVLGEEVLNVIHDAEIEDVMREGKSFAKKCGQNTLKDIIPLFGERNLVKEESCDKGLLFRQENGCPMSRISREEGLEEVMCRLHCSVDPYLVKGFNENIICEVRKSHLLGDEICEWYIYEK